MRLLMAAELPTGKVPYEGRLLIAGEHETLRVAAKPGSVWAETYAYRKGGHVLHRHRVTRHARGTRISLIGPTSSCVLQGDGEEGNRLRLPMSGLRLFNEDLMELLNILVRRDVTELELTVVYRDLTWWQWLGRKQALPLLGSQSPARHDHDNRSRGRDTGGNDAHADSILDSDLGGLRGRRDRRDDDGGFVIVPSAPYPEPSHRRDAPQHETGGRVGGEEPSGGPAFRTGGVIQGSHFHTRGRDDDRDFIPVGDGGTKFGGAHGGVKDQAPAPAGERTFGGGSSPAADTGSSKSSSDGGGGSDVGGGGGDSSGE